MLLFNYFKNWKILKWDHSCFESKLLPLIARKAVSNSFQVTKAVLKLPSREKGPGQSSEHTESHACWSVRSPCCLAIWRGNHLGGLDNRMLYSVHLQCTAEKPKTYKWTKTNKQTKQKHCGASQFGEETISGTRQENAFAHCTMYSALQNIQTD